MKFAIGVAYLIAIYRFVFYCVCVFHVFACEFGAAKFHLFPDHYVIKINTVRSEGKEERGANNFTFPTPVFPINT